MINLVVPTESEKGERRVALTPEIVSRLAKRGYGVRVEKGAGFAANYLDADYAAAGAAVVAPDAIYKGASIVLRVGPPSSSEILSMPEGTILVGFLQPHRHPDRVQLLARRGITSLAMELIPRITRAQSMDALSSQATVVGYKAALLAASLSGRFLPMLTTAAGTIRPARVLVMGVGVAGLQAIATARRLGAIVEAYDVRRAAKEQAESLGARFIELPISAEGEGGYARELTAEEQVIQQEALARHVGNADVVITTAMIPGRAAPRLLTRDMVERMRPGSVVIDLAAESGGNCELTRSGERFMHKGILIDGPVNLPSELPIHASEMYAKNLYNLLEVVLKNGSNEPDWQDEILKGALLTKDGVIMHEPTRSLVQSLDANGGKS